MAWLVELLDQRVERELAAFPSDMRARFLHVAELLETFGPQHVGMPYVRPLGRKLWEMRLTGRSGIGRVIYTAAKGRRLVVLHAFVKKSQTTPRRSLELAGRRAKEIE